ncbi:hypothetical protein C8T65DRAFT_583310 [Cerioporus squamosus]|nr:hypothetical protein C8T65DRAFT_583310 [Cerioporus squamosus]
MSSEGKLLPCSDRNATAAEVKPHNKLLTPALQRTGVPTSLRVSCGEARRPPRPSSPTCAAQSSALVRRPPSLDGQNKNSCTHPTSRVRVPPRVRVPVPFSDACITNRVVFSFRGCRGISLGEWARLSEKGKTYLGVDDAHESVDELLSGEGQSLFQSHWPGYDPRTCYLDLPAHVTTGERSFAKADLLDMVCQALVDWVLKVTNCRQIECREPEWAIGLKQITFRHIYVTSVVEVKGYVSKWVPILEIDPRAFQPQCQL